MEFTSNDKIGAIRDLTDALFENVLHDEDPIFLGDLATLLDVSTAGPEELQRRILDYYKTTVTLEDLRRPLWQLLPELERRRLAAGDGRD